MPITDNDSNNEMLSRSKMQLYWMNFVAAEIVVSVGMALPKHMTSLR